MIDLKFLGIGSALSTDFNNNCAIFYRNNEILVIDPNTKCVKFLVNHKILNTTTKKVVIVVTHTHADHISGLGALVWQCEIAFKIKPTIVSNTPTFAKHVENILDLLGVSKNYYEFSKTDTIDVANTCVKMLKTTHAEELECFSILISDKDGKYYYSGDTNDIETAKKMIADPEVKKVYLELSHYPKSHIEYNEIKIFENKQKVIGMHITKSLMKEIKKDRQIKIAKEYK